MYKGDYRNGLVCGRKLNKTAVVTLYGQFTKKEETKEEKERKLVN